MTITTILGRRTEIIRLSLVIAKLDRLCDNVLVYKEPRWRVPPEYLVEDVSTTVARTVFGFAPRV